VLTGLEEADRRGLTSGVFFNITFRGAAVHSTVYTVHSISSTEQCTERVRDEIGGVYTVYALSAGAYTATLYVMVNIVKGGGRAPSLPPARVDFSS
jgi:hypothetical protein